MDPDYPNETCCVISSPFSFQQFQKLEYLEISFVVIFGYHQTSMASYSPHNLLPSSLRHLFLRDDLANCVDYEWEAPACLARLGELIPNCVGPDKLLPALKYLTLRVRNSFHEDWDESHQDELSPCVPVLALVVVFQRRSMLPEGRTLQFGGEIFEVWTHQLITKRSGGNGPGRRGDDFILRCKSAASIQLDV